MKKFRTFIAEAKKKPPPIEGWFKEKDNDEPNHDKLSDKLAKDHKGMSARDKKTFLDYTVHPDEERDSKKLGPAIKRNPIKRQLHVYSGLGHDPDEETKNGNVTVGHHMSASHNKEVAHDFASQWVGGDGDVAHIAHIHLKPGDNATHIHKSLSASPDEHETIIAAGTKLKKIGHRDYHCPFVGGIVRVHHYKTQ